MKIIFQSTAINEFGKEVVIRISEPESGMTYGYSVKLPSEINTTRGVYGTYTRSYDELSNDEIIEKIVKKAKVRVVK